jgi:hypothetical protein
MLEGSRFETISQANKHRRMQILRVLPFVWVFNEYNERVPGCISPNGKYVYMVEAKSAEGCLGENFLETTILSGEITWPVQPFRQTEGLLTFQ